MMTNIETMMQDPGFVGRSFPSGDRSFKVAVADNFEYTDPIDGSVSVKQVVTQLLVGFTQLQPKLQYSWSYYFYM